MAKAPQQKLKVFPNPYNHLDHRGWLAGACPQGEEVRSGSTLPVRASVGATRHVLQYDPGEPAPVPGAVPLRFSRTVLEWIHAAEPLEVPFSGGLVDFYLQRLRSRELFEVVAPGRVKVHSGDRKVVEMDLLDALAAARSEAVLGYVDAYGKQPPTEKWAKQFEFEPAVAAESAKAIELGMAQRAERAAQQKSAEKKPKPAAKSNFPMRPPAADGGDKAIHGDDGGTPTPSAPLVFGGAGLKSTKSGTSPKE